MIKVTDKYGIEVSNNCYTTGKIVHNKKQDTDILINARYFTKIIQAISDITERVAKDKISKKDINLEEALKEIKTVYNNFSNKIEQLEKTLKNDFERKDKNV